ncbi:MAG: hypothetical protein KC433_16435 [Anaerolineales bacterium]|nr:hypothetical protein [Anaerolineales bacterium]
MLKLAAAIIGYALTHYHLSISTAYDRIAAHIRRAEHDNRGGARRGTVNSGESVARALWKPHPDLHTAAAAWILAGGAHHTGFSLAISAEYLEDFAEISGVEYLLIDKMATLSSIKDALRWNDVHYLLVGRV